MENNSESHLQGVACCCLDPDRSVQETIIKLLDLKVSSSHQGVECLNLDLINKYYKATIHLFDYDKLENNDEKKNITLDKSHAIILHANGQKVTTELLDDKVKQLSTVKGEPRILMFDGIDEGCESYRTIQDWSIKNGYDLINACDEGARDLLIDSLSAYKWTHRSNITAPATTSSSNNNHQDKGPKLNSEVLKKLEDFDSLLGKISAYRDRPELRGDPDDKKIKEIAQILSGLLEEDDAEDWLENIRTDEA